MEFSRRELAKMKEEHLTFQRELNKKERKIKLMQAELEKRERMFNMQWKVLEHELSLFAEKRFEYILIICHFFDKNCTFSKIL